MEALRHEILLAVSENQWGNGLFVPNDAFKDLFTEEVITQIHNIDPEIFIEDLSKTIATLIYNNRLNSDFLEAFHIERFKDRYLPVEYDKTKRVFRSIRQGRYFDLFSSAADCIAFEHDQWLFCSPSFGNAEHQELDSRCPLPIIHCSLHSARLRGDVYKVKLHHAHLKVKPRPTEEDNPFLAMKRIVSGAHWEQGRELRLFQRSQRLQHPHLIKLTASFTSGKDYFFLFPWANGGNLQTLWQGETNLEKRSPEMVYWVVKQMMGIVGAIKEIHSPTESAGEDEGECHGVLKPDNIVLFIEDLQENPRGVLRITDTGLNRFHRKVTSKWMGPYESEENSLEYGPPGVERGNSRDNGSPHDDMWSLGCLFLEFIVWVLGGMDEVRRFRAGREKKCPHREFYQKTMFGYDVQPEVRRYIDLILNDKRCQGNNLFRDVTNIIKHHLLKTRESKRVTSAELELLLLFILEKGKATPSYLCGPNSESGFYPESIGYPQDLRTKRVDRLITKKR